MITVPPAAAHVASNDDRGHRAAGVLEPRQRPEPDPAEDGVEDAGRAGVEEEPPQQHRHDRRDDDRQVRQRAVEAAEAARLAHDHGQHERDREPDDQGQQGEVGRCWRPPSRRAGRPGPWRSCRGRRTSGSRRGSSPGGSSRTPGRSGTRRRPRRSGGTAAGRPACSARPCWAMSARFARDAGVWPLPQRQPAISRVRVHLCAVTGRTGPFPSPADCARTGFDGGEAPIDVVNQPWSRMAWICLFAASSSASMFAFLSVRTACTTGSSAAYSSWV